MKKVHFFTDHAILLFIKEQIIIKYAVSDKGVIMQHFIRIFRTAAQSSVDYCL